MDIKTQLSPIGKPKYLRNKVFDINERKAELDKLMNNFVPGREYWTEAFYYLQTLMNKKEYNSFSIVKTEEGILNTGSFVPPDLSDLRKKAKFYQKLKNSTENIGGRFIVYNPPIRPSLTEVAQDTFVPQLNLNPRIDAFLQHLREFGVDFIDGRYSLADLETLPPKMMQYKTDRLWTSQTSFEAFKNLVGMLAEKYALDLDPDEYYRDQSNYEFTTYPNYFLGMLAVNTSRLIAGLDDFTAISPKFNNNYIVEFMGTEHGYAKVEGGNFAALYNLAALIDESSRADNLKAVLPYNYYLGGLHSMVTITNNDHPERPMVLLIHDAFGVPLGSFMAPLSGKMVLVNPYSGGVYVPELNRFITDQKFDLVIVVTSIYSI